MIAIAESELAINEFAIDAKYSDCLRTFVETTLNEVKIGQMFGIPTSTIATWVKEYDWQRIRNNFRKINTGQTVRANTVKRILETSSDIAEQLSIVGNSLLQEAYASIMANPDAISVKDKMGFALKIKELEAKVTGQIQASSTTNIVTQNTIFRKLSEEGIEGFYGAEVMDATVTEVIETSVQRPDYNKQLEAKKINKDD